MHRARASVVVGIRNREYPESRNDSAGGFIVRAMADLMHYSREMGFDINSRMIENARKLHRGEFAAGLRIDEIHDGCGGTWKHDPTDTSGLIDRCSRCGEERA